MCLKPFILKVNVKTLHATNVTVWLFVFSNLHAFLPEFWELIDNGAREDLEDDLLCEHNV